MDINKLNEFSILADSDSFASAARKIGISPALLSIHIENLEKQVGVTLIERGRSFELTDAGKRFLVDAKEISDEYKEILHSIRHETQSSDKSISIGITYMTIPGKLGPYLDTVNLRYPDFRLNIYDGMYCSIEEGLKNGKIDVFFSSAPDSYEIKDVVKEPVFSVGLCALLPLNHHLAKKSSITMKQLDGERFVLNPWTKEPAPRFLEEEILRKSGISFSIYQGDINISSYSILVPIGKGIAFCTKSETDMIPPNSVAVPIADKNVYSTMYMFRSRQSDNPFLQEFLDGFRVFNHKETIR